jgi:ABC-type nitrate/sulfonate/bicarbonate transport system substrate-binding protein
MKRSTIAVVLLGLVLCVAVGVFVFSQLTIPKKYTGPPAQVTIGTPLLDLSGLIWIAEEHGYSAKSNLKVTVKDFDSGKDAVDALLGGEVDIAATSEFILVGKAMKEEKIQTIGSIAKQDPHYLIGRKDRGIEKASDLKGKRIGLTRQTIPEFYLGRYLQLHGMNLDDVTIIDLKPTQVEESLIKGDVDAVLTWDPYAYSVEKSLGGNAVIWPAQSGQMMFWLLIAKLEYVARHPEVIDQLLSSFNQAEQFAVNYPDKAKKIVQNRLHTEDEYVERIWPRLRLTLSLDQGLIIAMEDESRWMIDNNLISNRKMPYYPDYIYWQGLKKVKPSSVTVIH